MNTSTMLENYKIIKGHKANVTIPIFVATDNESKLKHYKDLFRVVGDKYGVNIDIKTPKDLHVHVDVDEDGKTLEENSMKKAYEYKVALNNKGYVSMPVVADDSGLFITELNGFPGLYTRRCAPEGQHSKLYIEKCKGLTDRSATYESAFTYISPYCDISISAHLSRQGRISYEIQGTEGNCVENVFIPEELFNAETRSDIEREFYEHHMSFNPYTHQSEGDLFKTLGCREMEVFRNAGHQVFDLLNMVIFIDDGSEEGYSNNLMGELILSAHDIHFTFNPHKPEKMIPYDMFCRHTLLGYKPR